MEYNLREIEILFKEINKLSFNDLLGIPFILKNTSLKDNSIQFDKSNHLIISIKPEDIDKYSFTQLKDYISLCLKSTNNTNNLCGICLNLWSNDNVIKCSNYNCNNYVHESCYGLLPRDNSGNWYCWDV